MAVFTKPIFGVKIDRFGAVSSVVRALASHARGLDNVYSDVVECLVEVRR